MRRLSQLLYLSLLFSINYGAALLDAAAFASDVELSSCIRKEVQDVSAINEYATRTGRGVFFLDADEVLFTTAYEETLDVVHTVRLYPDLEKLIGGIKERGHVVVIMTYNFATAIRQKLKEIGLDVTLFDRILSCEMEGDVMTSKGRLLKGFIAENPFDFGVFIDNFPPFVEDVERVARECALQLYSFICTGYIEMYYRYVYYRLSQLCADIVAGNDVSRKISEISDGIERYKIDISSFKRKYPTFTSFRERIKGLIWPYLTYR